MVDQRDLRHDQLPPYSFTDDGCKITPDPLAKCRLCKMTTAALIEGDDALVCRDCIKTFVGIVVRPDTVPEAVLTKLSAQHSAVMQLVRLATGERMWHWIAGWPGVEPRGSSL